MRDKVAVIGTGLIGRAWAISFARAGYNVALHDAQDGSVTAATRFIDSVLPDLDANGLLGGHAPDTVRARITQAADMRSALDGALHVQESTPERIDTKIAVFRELDALAGADAIIASSTSALLPSRFTEELPGRHRCLVIHPINPPYLVPAVEIVPAPWTSPETVARARNIMVAAGHAPIVMQREIDGFVMNRLQGALLQEAFRLVAEGYVSADDLDIGIRDGLGLRWAFIGPFETIDLNAPDGVADYIARYEGLYQTLWATQQHIVDWGATTGAGITAARATALPRDQLAERARWRDRRLMALLAHKRDAADTIGS